MNILKKCIKHSTYIVVILVITILSLLIKTFFYPVPDIQGIKDLANDYVKNKINFSVGTIIYSRDYGNISGVDSWRVDISNDYNQLVCTLRYHPITGEIISVEERN